MKVEVQISRYVKSDVRVAGDTDTLRPSETAWNMTQRAADRDETG